MPLPTDEKLLALSRDVLAQFDAIFGLHPGFRPVHAKGVMLSGTFMPWAAARSVTRAPHIQRASTPVSVRFSNSTGLPLIPDNDPNADPRGLAIRFHLAEHSHTDIVAHSTDGFPARTGEEFLELLRALAATGAGKTSSPGGPSPIEAFLGSHPAALAYVQTPKPAPSSFARETYFGVTAFHFTNESGQTRFGRYRIIPAAGNDHLDAASAATKPANYLFDEVQARVARSPIELRVCVQLAESGDVVDDATIHWPEDRTVVELGKLVLTQVIADEKKIIFDPIPRVDGIEPSADPLLELRASVYLMSGRRRRLAGD